METFTVFAHSSLFLCVFNSSRKVFALCNVSIHFSLKSAYLESLFISKLIIIFVLFLLFLEAGLNTTFKTGVSRWLPNFEIHFHTLPDFSCISECKAELKHIYSLSAFSIPFHFNSHADEYGPALLSV